MSCSSLAPTVPPAGSFLTASLIAYQAASTFAGSLPSPYVELCFATQAANAFWRASNA